VQKFTDRWTDDGRRAIALAHSWNELKMSFFNEIDNVTIPVAFEKIFER